MVARGHSLSSIGVSRAASEDDHIMMIWSLQATSVAVSQNDAEHLSHPIWMACPIQQVRHQILVKFQQLLCLAFLLSRKQYISFLHMHDLIISQHMLHRTILHALDCTRAFSPKQPSLSSV